MSESLLPDVQEPTITPDPDMVSLGDIGSDISNCLVYDQKGNPERVDIPKCIEKLITYLNIKTILETGEMLFYRGGVYQPYAQEYTGRLLTYAFHGITTTNGSPVFNQRVKREILAQLKDITYMPVEKFDSNLDIVNLSNGLYNWRMGEFKPHDLNYLSLIQIPVEYNPDAKCPNIEKCFSVIFKPENIQKIIEFIGYMLYRAYPARKAFVLLGPSGTGKSIFIGICTGFVGKDNASSVALQELIDDRFAASDLYCKLLNECGDIPALPIRDTAIIKRLTGNKDEIRAQKKNKDAFKFVNFGKLLFSANRLPKVQDKNSGWYNRIELIPMDQVLASNEFSTEFLKALTSPEELSGLFNFAMEGLRRLANNSWVFTNQTDLKTATNRYEILSSPIESFIEAHLEESPDKWVTRTEVYEAYQIFCNEQGVESLTQAKLSQELRKSALWLKDVNSRDNRKVKGKSELIWPNTRLKV
jgi:putative DNA primase/helicase